MSASYAGTIETALSLEAQQRMDTEGKLAKEKFEKVIA